MNDRELLRELVAGYCDNPSGMRFSCALQAAIEGLAAPAAEPVAQQPEAPRCRDCGAASGEEHSLIAHARASERRAAQPPEAPPAGPAYLRLLDEWAPEKWQCTKCDCLWRLNPSFTLGRLAGERSWSLFDGGQKACAVCDNSPEFLSVIKPVDENDALLVKLSGLLTRTANALKGEPEPLHSHSWHDLPEVAATYRERERALREMLAYTYGGASLYRDDGELQDNSTLPCIDFRRDSVDDIQAKMRERSINALATPDSAASPTGGEG